MGSISVRVGVGVGVGPSQVLPVCNFYCQLMRYITENCALAAVHGAKYVTTECIEPANMVIVGTPDLVAC